MTLAEKIAKSKEILQEALDKFLEKIAMVWTGGKDSTTTLHLVRELGKGKVPIPVLNIDTGVNFKEIYQFRDRLAQEWDLDLRIERNEEAIRTIQIAEDKEECCLKLQTEVIKLALIKYGWEALISGERWDDRPNRQQESYFTSRKDPPHTRVHPILHFTEMDIWQYLKELNVPYCPLYCQGYRSLGCEPCSRIGSAQGPECPGRDQQKEEIMKRLIHMGYL